MHSLEMPSGALVLPPSLDGGFRQWCSFIDELFPPLLINPLEHQPFEGSIYAAGASVLRVTHQEASPHAAERRARKVSLSDDHFLKLTLHLEGTSTLIHRDRESVLRPGDIGVYDTSQPYVLDNQGRASFIVAMFPLDAIQPYAPDAPGLAGAAIDGGTGLPAVVANYLRSLGSDLGTFAGRGGARMARAGVELIGAMLAEQTDAQGAAEPAAVLWRQVQDYIEATLSDPDLTPRGIAEANFISLRRLHALFQSEGKTVAGWVRRLRLERCLEDLRDPLQRDRRIADIGARWGLVDAGHLAKIFKETYGVSPSQVREQGS